MKDWWGGSQGGPDRSSLTVTDRASSVTGRPSLVSSDPGAGNGGSFW